MSLKVEIDTSGLMAKLEAMEERIKHFKAVDIGAEMSAWQLEDLHRNRPFTMRSRKVGKATTVVRPHSKYEMMKSAMYQKKYRRLAFRGSRKRRAQAWQHWRMATSTRPILREALEQELSDRMVNLLNEKIHW